MATSARIDELKKKFDENPRRYFASLANEYRKAGDLDQALFICQEYLPQQPGHMSGHIVLAQTLYEMARYPDAKAEFESALALDPENLIALRHLGDIARQAGDPRTARNWYQRVLEADPRNAEIVDVLASLRTTPMASSAGISAIPPTPLSSPVMPPPVVAAPAPAPPPVQPPQTAKAPEPKEEHELLDFEEISLGETPLSTPSVSADAARPVASATASSLPDVSDDEPFEMEREGEGETFEVDSLAIAATPSPDIEPASEINLGLIGEDVTPASSSQIPPPVIEGLRSYEAGTLIDGLEPIDKSLETEPYYDVLHGEARSTPPETSAAESMPPSDDDFASEVAENLVLDSHEHAEPSAHESVGSDAVGEHAWESEQLKRPVIASTPIVASTPAASFTPAEPAEPVVPPTATPARTATPISGSETFVTETMAELYLHQGHLDSALDIYRRLHEHRPDDARLVEQIRSVEARMSGRVSRKATPEQPVAAVASGPTIREYLVTLVASSGGNGSATPRESVREVFSGSNAVAEQVSGSIDALFPGADASPSDAAAASALADAFSASDADMPMLDAQPTHRATNELSLDQVFKGATPIRTDAQPEGFSFDQFFAGESNSSTAAPPTTNAPAAEGTDDIAQFNAWLNGLKKT